MSDTCKLNVQIMKRDSASLPDGLAWMRYVCSECGAGMSPEDDKCPQCERIVEHLRDPANFETIYECGTVMSDGMRDMQRH